MEQKHKHYTSKLFLRAFTLELIKNSILQIPTTNRIEFQPLLVQPIKINLPEVETNSQPEFSQLQKSILDIRPIARMKPSSIRSEPSIPLQPPIQNPVQPTANPLPQGFNLAKLEFLLHDPRVTIIECPGPGKLVLARASGRTALTKISLNPDEIQSIIQQFSQEARIPIISGLFKAAVGNLILTAVISELVGSRFIITKVTPQFFLEQTASKK
ncbi:MAG: hypothetical protein NT076_05580 [Candidatus Pacearchaeota archaeon]|nr:hypothetical protein [Candidatus Pacearchaeota archaeon]